jgi:hypothetical protein
VREAIGDARGQLHSSTAGRWPGLVVVYDNTGLYYHDDCYHILTAMFGLEAQVLEVDPAPSTLIRRLGFRFAGKRKTTPNQNTTVSGVGRLYRGPEGEPRLDIFHNPYAAAPLRPEKWRARTFRHFVRGDPDSEGRQGWREV